MSLIIQRDQEQELIIEKISELLKKEGWEVKSIFPYFHKNRTTVQVIIRKNYNTNIREAGLTMKIPIQCKLCEYNFQNEYCQYDEREDKFLESNKCGEFKFEPYHLIEYLKEV